MTPGAEDAVDPVAAQTDAVLHVLDAALPAGLVLAVARYGSAVVGGLRPESDLDLFGVVRRPLIDAEKRDLVAGLVPISWRAHRPPAWRPVNLTLVVSDEVRPWRYPPRLDFQYGEWLRDELLAGNLAPWPPTNPDVAVLITMLRATGVPVRGPAPAELLDRVPRADLMRAMLDELPRLLDDLDSDTRNVLLTLARMWTTVATGKIRTKDGAATWALGRLPASHRPVLELARAAYLGEIDDRWDDGDAVRSVADAMADRIRGAPGGSR
jgi:predicted nucleotidyltransferase